MHPLGHGRVDHCANHGLRKCPIKGQVDLRDPGGGREPALVGRVIAAERSDVIEDPCLAPHHPIAGDEIGVGRITGLVLKHGLVEARRQGVDQIDIA